MQANLSFLLTSWDLEIRISPNICIYLFLLFFVTVCTQQKYNEKFQILLNFYRYLVILITLILINFKYYIYIYMSEIKHPKSENI